MPGEEALQGVLEQVDLFVGGDQSLAELRELVVLRRRQTPERRQRERGERQTGVSGKRGERRLQPGELAAHRLREAPGERRELALPHLRPPVEEQPEHERLGGERLARGGGERRRQRGEERGAPGEVGRRQPPGGSGHAPGGRCSGEADDARGSAWREAIRNGGRGGDRQIGRTRRVEAGDPIVVDGDNAQVLVRPAEDILQTVHLALDARAERRRKYAALRDLPPATRDQARISLNMNAGLLIDMQHLDDTGADGVGL